MQDYTALSVMDDVNAGALFGNKVRRSYAVRYLQRWQLGTPYPVVVEDVEKFLARPPLLGSRTVLAVDATGVGRPVVDQFARLALKATLVPITITGAQALGAHRDKKYGWRVPKKDIVGVLQMLLGQRRLKVAKIPERETLLKELRTFKVKVNKDTGNEAMEGWRTSDHDDTVLCLLGNTPILTERGWVSIRDVTTTDRVLTRQGWKKVARSWMSSPAARTIAIEYSNGCVLQCTPEHPVWSVIRGWVPARELQLGEGVLSCPSGLRRASGEAEYGAGIQTSHEDNIASISSAIQSGRKHLSFCTGRSGRLCTDPYQMATQSTTRTRIPSTTMMTIWSASLSRSTWIGTERLCAGVDRVSGSLPTCESTGRRRLLDSLPGGIHQKGTPLQLSMVSESWKPVPYSTSLANTAESLSDLHKQDRSVVQNSAIGAHTHGRRPTPAIVKSVDRTSLSSGDHSGFVVTRVLRFIENESSEAVYDLTVEDAHEFVAAGVLVHNSVGCGLWLAERYWRDRMLLTLSFGGDRKRRQLHIVVCTLAELERLEIDPSHRCVLIRLEEPHTVEEGGDGATYAMNPAVLLNPPPSYNMNLLEALTLSFAPLDPDLYKSAWTEPVPGYNRTPEHLVMTADHGRKLWGLLTRRRGAQAPDVIVVAGGEDGRALSLAMGVCDSFRLKRSTIYRVAFPDGDNLDGVEPPLHHVYNLVKATHGASF